MDERREFPPEWKNCHFYPRNCAASASIESSVCSLAIAVNDLRWYFPVRIVSILTAFLLHALRRQGNVIRVTIPLHWVSPLSTG